MVARADFLTRISTVPQRDRGGAFFLILIDIDDFDDVNHVFGVTTGDLVLVHLVSVLEGAIGSRSWLCRIDGDEFAVLGWFRREPDAVRMARKLLLLVGQPLMVGDLSIRLTGRAGVTSVASGDDPVTTTLRQAQVALDSAKSARNVAPVCYRPGTHLDRRVILAQELLDALGQQQLALAFQPIVDMATRQVVGFESLLRWPRPDGSEIAPTEFVSVAESFGSIVPIGRWVLDRAAAAAAALSAAGRAGCTMSVNVSPRQLEDAMLLTHLERALAAHRLDPCLLALEITESAAVESRQALAALRAARSLGCQVGLDDFGTGYSCLGALHKLPLDFVKIDRSFICQLGEDPRMEPIVGAIVGIAGELGLDTVAEGIETQLQWRRATEAGCTRGQGFLFGRPAFGLLDDGPT